VTGKSVEEAKALLREAKLDPVVSADPVYVSYAPAGTVAYSYPGNGAAVYPGQRVVIYVSAGAPAGPTETTVPGPGQPSPGDTCGSSHRPGCR
jgi:beta-lactam-binding protein with PASTA domain